MRTQDYDRDILQMYGTAEPSLTFIESADLRAVAVGSYSYPYYPLATGAPIEGASLYLNFTKGLYAVQSADDALKDS